MTVFTYRRRNTIQMPCHKLPGSRPEIWRAPDGISRRAPLVCSQSISRVLDGMRTVPACATAIPLGRPLPDASSNQPGRQDLDTDPGTFAPHRPYSVLLPVGFALPPALPPARCALTAPFHPYRGCYATRRGGLFSVALSLGSRPPDVIRHRWSTEPGLSSPACAGAAVRPTDAIGMMAPASAVKCQDATTSGSKLMTRAAMVLGRSRWASSSRKVARVDASHTPSMRSGRKWRWNAVTTSCVVES